jgi:inorganic pyrophosphatase
MRTNPLTRFAIILFLVATLSSCLSNKNEEFKNDGLFTAIIVIPAGTNKKFEFNDDSKKFECEKINGEDRIVNYLPYPGNYGYLLNTYMNPELGGDGDALDVLVIDESIAQGSKVKIEPLAILKLLDNGEEDHKIIAISTNSKINRFVNGIPKSAEKIITTWFCNYKKNNVIKFQQWGSKEQAIKEIEKWSTSL